MARFKMSRRRRRKMVKRLIRKGRRIKRINKLTRGGFRL